MTQARSIFLTSNSPSLIKTAQLLVMLMISFVFVYWVYNTYAKTTTLSPQSEIMLQAGLNGRWFGVFGTGPWPPGYAVLLAVANALELAPLWVNLLLFYLSLILFTVVSMRCVADIHPIWPLLLYVIGAFNYYNLSQFTSEAVVIPLSMLIFLSMLAYIKEQTFLKLLWLALFCTALFLSRYHAILWLLPLVLLHTVRGNPSLSTRLRHLFAFGAIAMGPITLFMLGKFLRTGYLTGMPRFSYESRLITIVVWTLGNNDPIYSRFLYPSYPYLILAFFAGYAFIARWTQSVPIKWLFLLLYGAVIATNLTKMSSTLASWTMNVSRGAL